MNLASALKSIQEVVSKHGESLVLVKEPDLKSIDIDILITNRRSTDLQKDILSSVRIPFLFDTENRCFGYYLEDGEIGSIDLFDFPIFTDSAIRELAQDTVPSSFDNSIPKLSHDGQLIYYIYKSLKKWKIKEHRYNFILQNSANLDHSKLSSKLADICQIQRDNGTAANGQHILDALVLGELSFEKYCNLIRLNRTKVCRIKTLIKIVNFQHSVLCRSQKKDFYKKLPLINVIGIDGAGKSSMVDKLNVQNQSIPSQQFRFETKSHLKGYDNLFYIIPRFFHMLKRLGIGFNLHVLESSLLANLTFLESRVKVNVFSKMTLSGKMVIVDRWWFDYWAASKRSHMIHKNPQLFRRYESLAKPDLIIFMTAPYSIIADRRPEENLEELKSKHERLLNMVDGYNHLLIDGSKDIVQNFHRVNTAIYNYWIGIQRK